MVFAMNNVEERLRKQNVNLNNLLSLMNEWIGLYQRNKCLASFFNHYKYSTIAIYGMGIVGEKVFDELISSSIKISYCIDNDIYKKKYRGVEIITSEEEFENVDAIVVTPITYFDEIKEQIGKRVECPIVSLEDIIYELY